MTKKTQKSFAAPGNRQEKGQKRNAAAKLDLADAYHAVFYGKPTEEQRDMVLVDLATFSGFYTVAPEGQNLQRHEGRREVFGRIYSMVRMTPAERFAYETAVRDSHFVDYHEGELV